MTLALVLSSAADPSGVTPLDALGLFLGIPVLIVAVVVGAVYGARWRRQRGEGRSPQARSAEPERLTEPVLGSPDQWSRRRDRGGGGPGDRSETGPDADRTTVNPTSE